MNECGEGGGNGRASARAWMGRSGTGTTGSLKSHTRSGLTLKTFVERALAPRDYTTASNDEFVNFPLADGALGCCKCSLPQSLNKLQGVRQWIFRLGLDSTPFAG
jgi:hypothetical protein